MNARDLITAKKKPGEKYTVLESIIMAWYVNHPLDADEAADKCEKPYCTCVPCKPPKEARQA